MVPFLPDRYSRVLEVGCGEGVFSTILSQPYEMWGVEPEPASAARAASVLHTVLVGRFDEVSHKLPERYFDLVVCNDVIEHLPDPELFLRAVQRCMTPGAHLIASIPNMRHWEVLWQLLARKDWQYGRDGIMDRTHLRFFTEKSIKRLFQETGFDIERASGINGAFDPVRRSALLALSALTLGYYSDIQYRQFGLLARLR
jgi:2-polyprenyl-3-methyl-5-hydroxy-6-metoxy-1,4-benzoquinol methylase